MPTPLVAVEAALRAGGVKAALQQLETVAAAEPGTTQPGAKLRRWLVQSATIDVSIVDRRLLIIATAWYTTMADAASQRPMKLTT